MARNAKYWGTPAPIGARLPWSNWSRRYVGLVGKAGASHVLFSRDTVNPQHATLLNVTANTLRAWESRFDFPTPQRSPGNHRSYLHCEVAALRQALCDGLSISSAVVRAREALVADGRSLITAFEEYDRERADAAMEAALGFRSVELSAEEVLLPTLEQIRRDQGVDSAAWAFAAPWGGDWLRRATRLAPPGLMGRARGLAVPCCLNSDP